MLSEVHKIYVKKLYDSIKYCDGLLNWLSIKRTALLSSQNPETPMFKYAIVFSLASFLSAFSLC